MPGSFLRSEVVLESEELDFRELLGILFRKDPGALVDMLPQKLPVSFSGNIDIAHVLRIGMSNPERRETASYRRGTADGINARQEGRL